MSAIKPKEIDYQELKKIIDNDPQIKYINKQIAYLYSIYMPKTIIYSDGRIEQSYPKELNKSLKKLNGLKSDYMGILKHLYIKINSGLYVK